MESGSVQNTGSGNIFFDTFVFFISNSNIFILKNLCVHEIIREKK